MEDVAVDPDFSASKARFSLLHLSPTLPSRPPSLGVKTPHRVQAFRAGASGFAPNSSACGARKSQKVEQGGYTRGQHLSTHTARRGGGRDRMSPRHAGTAGSPCQIFGFSQENRVSLSNVNSGLERCAGGQCGEAMGCRDGGVRPPSGGGPDAGGKLLGASREGPRGAAEGPAPRPCARAGRGSREARAELCG